jgi:hypothetical protein
VSNPDLHPVRRRSTVMRALVLAGAVALLATACRPPAPAAPVLQNGFLPPGVLYHVSASCDIWEPAAQNLLTMMDTAQLAGVDLKPEECYRSYAEQVADRNYWCGLGECQFAAVPGTSVHGWGKAVDFADQNGELTFSSVGYLWLKANAQNYCFVHPAWAEPTGSAPEPWHWEWVCG